MDYIINIRLGSSSFLGINLTEPLRQNTECYPEDPKPRLNTVFCSIDKTGFQYHTQLIGDHNFRAHIDAPRHQNPELQERGMEYWGGDRHFNRAIMIDLSNAPEALDIDGIKFLTEVREHHFEPYAPRISGKGALVIRTGYDRWLEENKPHTVSKIPYLTPDAADFVARFKNLRVFAIDSLTVDVNNAYLTKTANKPHYTHRKFNDLMIVESLVNLHAVPKTSRENFDLMTIPIAIEGATGGPSAVYALIEE